jgi:hypothetical protein
MILSDGRIVPCRIWIGKPAVRWRGGLGNQAIVVRISHTIVARGFLVGTYE